MISRNLRIMGNMHRAGPTIHQVMGNGRGNISFVTAMHTQQNIGNAAMDVCAPHRRDAFIQVCHHERMPERIGHTRSHTFLG
ncbi:MAG: hypothetical protein NVSMB38_24750 [Ktedonobacteraceae bacterium]